jgi:hypothetical protein
MDKLNLLLLKTAGVTGIAVAVWYLTAGPRGLR